MILSNSVNVRISTTENNTTIFKPCMLLKLLIILLSSLEQVEKNAGLFVPDSVVCFCWKSNTYSRNRWTGSDSFQLFKQTYFYFLSLEWCAESLRAAGRVGLAAALEGGAAARALRGGRATAARAALRRLGGDSSAPGEARAAAACNLAFLAFVVSHFYFLFGLDLV